MNIKGNTSININSLEDIGKINLSNLEYELNLKAKNMGFLSKKEKEQQKNGLSLNSSYGPFNFNIDILTQDSIDDLVLILKGYYMIEDDIHFGLKYETNTNDSNREILSGIIDSNFSMKNIKLNLNTENIIYGQEIKDNNCYKVYGNKINPNIGLKDNSISFGYIYDQKEKIDEFGNKDEDSNNKISMDIDISLVK